MLPEVQLAPSEVATGYAFELAGVPVVLPARVFMEYVASIQVQPLPRAAQRVIGLIQRRGTIVPVFDPCANRVSRALGKAVSALVIGDGANAAAVLIEGQPQLATALQSLRSYESVEIARPQHCIFTAALAQPLRLGAEGSSLHWLLDPEALFLSLSKSGYLS
jgi:hypothetical protein